jgi:hypothetical protein
MSKKDFDHAAVPFLLKFSLKSQYNPANIRDIMYIRRDLEGKIKKYLDVPEIAGGL